MGWKQYLGLEYVDYTDQLFQSLIRTRYSKRQFSLILTLIFVGLVKWYIKILFSFLVQIHPIFDFVLQIAFAVFLAFKDHWIRNVVDRFKTEIYGLSRYLINNYSPENFKVWKRNTVLVICLYFIIHILLIEITKWILIEQILHFLVSYFFIEGIESGLFLRCYERVKRFYEDHIQSKSSGNTFVEGKLYIREDYLGIGGEKCSVENNEGEKEELTKSWMLMSDVIVLEDSLNRSIVVFEE